MKQALVYRDGGKREVETAAASNDCRFPPPRFVPEKHKLSLDLYLGIT